MKASADLFRILSIFAVFFRFALMAFLWEDYAPKNEGRNSFVALVPFTLFASRGWPASLPFACGGIIPRFLFDPFCLKI
jgi:hypothetical protein